jgi:ribosomal protein S18 acetylase RimI-like enzyme
VQQFVAKHAEHVIGTLSGFDRLVFRGTMRALCSRSGLMSYLWAVQVRLTDFAGHALKLTEQLKDASLSLARHIGRPVQYLTSAASTDIEIITAGTIDDNICAAVERLHAQVSSAAAPTMDQLAAIIAGPGTRLLVARTQTEPTAIVGMLTMVIFQISSGLRVWIEDVVVDKAVRRQGIGEALNRTAIEQARAMGARTVDLTSRPERPAANELYRKIGFEMRRTNVYRMVLR